MSTVGQYSAAGAQISTTVCLVHDALGRLTAVGLAKAVLPGPGAYYCQSENDIMSFTARFEYDAMNRRVARQDGTVWTEYVHDPGGNLLAELTRPATSGGTWTTNREYAWLDGQPLAQLEYPAGSPADGYTYYFHLDHLGQPRALTNGAGTTVWKAAPARPYGDVVEEVFPDGGRTVVTNLRLPGQYDERLFTAAGLTGLQGPYYNWNRWYLPTLGRYMELDPIATSGGFNGPWGPNWYGYAEGNPLRYLDWDASQAAPAYPPPPVWPGAANGPMLGGGAGGAAGVGGAVAGGLAISAFSTWLMCATTGNYYDFCKFWFPPNAGPRKRGNQDPPWAKQPPWNKKSYNPGRGTGGDCNPCGPNSDTWTHDDGTTHQMQWDQRLSDCECFSKREHLNCSK